MADLNILDTNYEHDDSTIHSKTFVSDVRNISDLTRIQNPGVPITKFSYEDFNYDDLLDLKNKKGLKIGVGIPIKNEEDTLGDVLDSLQEHKQNGLIDSYAVFDSSSTDSSKLIALNRGIDFIVDSDVADNLGLKKGIDWKSGKGFNLWNSLDYFKGYDLVTWVDADIDLAPRYLYGILGPLITDDEMVFSKGTYKRDMGDSRVSAYTVDPVLGLLFPEAGYLSDPLCGFFGGRTEFLKNIPFSTGYSVEVVTTIHALMSDKNDKISQVNLGELRNREHNDKYLSAMGATITSAIFDLAVKYGKIKHGKDTSEVIIQRDCSSDSMTNEVLTNFKDIMLNPISHYSS